MWSGDLLFEREKDRTLAFGSSCVLFPFLERGTIMESKVRYKKHDRINCTHHVYILL